jgi:hypothetical protein
MRAIDLDAASRRQLPSACLRCTWWQPAGRDEWEAEVETETGLFGRLLFEGDDVLGAMQAAPVRLVPRSRRLPAGPPDLGAWLLLCAYLYDDERPESFEFLLLDLVAALKIRHVDALEAFAVEEPRAGDRLCGYVREANLFNAAALEGIGFRRVRRLAGIGRYRLEMATLADAPRKGHAADQRAAEPATLPA